MTETPLTAIAVHRIVVPSERMRRLRPELVAELVESISAQGLLQPIIVRPRGAANYWLVAGRHRLEAVRQCGHDHIRAVVLDGLDADAALLAEVDENLVRADLSPAERAMHVARRKVLYEKLHPETKHGGDRKSATAKSRSQNENLKTFAADSAQKTGKSRATVARDWTRANKVVVLADIVGTALDEGAEIDALAKLPDGATKRRPRWTRRAPTGTPPRLRSVTKRRSRKPGAENERAHRLPNCSFVLARNLAEVIDDLYRSNAPPRHRERMLDLVQGQIERAMWLGRLSVQQQLVDESLRSEEAAE
jgi:ParB-like chromosome segregation protein Spo0J